MQRASTSNAVSTPQSRASATRRAQDRAIALIAMKPAESLEECADKARTLLELRTTLLDDPIDWLTFSVLIDIATLEKQWTTHRRVRP